MASKVTESNANRTLVLNNFQTGLIDSIIPSKLPITAIQSGSNMYFKYGNTLTTRFGFSQASASSALASSSGINGLWGYYPNSGDRTLIIASDTNIYSGAGASKTNLTSSLGLTSNLVFNGAQFNDKMFLVNGTDNCVTITAGVGASASAVPKGTIVVEHKDMLFIAGVAAYPNRLYYSAIGDGTTWVANSIIDVISNDGFPITNLVSFGEELIIFKGSQVFQLSGGGSASFLVRRITTEWGCAGVRSAAIVGDENEYICFLDPRGPRIVLMDKSHNLRDITTDFIPGVMATLNKSRLNRCVITYYKNMIILNVVVDSGATKPDTRLVYSMDRKAWCPVWTKGFSAEVLYDSGISLTYYSGDSLNGAIYTQDTSQSDNTVKIACSFKTRDEDFSFSNNKKKLKRLWTKTSFTGVVSTQKVRLVVTADSARPFPATIDYGNSVALLVGTAVVGDRLQEAVYSSKRERIKGTGKLFNFEFLSDDIGAAGQAISVESFQVSYKIKQLR